MTGTVIHLDSLRNQTFFPNRPRGDEFGTTVSNLGDGVTFTHSLNSEEPRSGLVLMPHRARTGPAPLPIPSTWAEPLLGWTYALRAAGRSENTITTRTDHLRRLARAFPPGPWELTGSRLVVWAGQQAWSRETRRSVYASVRGFYRWAAQSGLVDASPAAALPSVRPEEPSPRPIPERLYMAALLDANDRDELILRLAGEVGMRRAEIAQVHVGRDMVEDLDGWTLIVHGKGGKDREVPLPPHLAATMRLRGRGWLFPGDDHGHLSARWIGKLGTRALPEHWTLHPLRHRFSSVSFELDRDLMTLRDLLGHASVATTQRYVRVRDEAKRRLVMSVARYRRAA